ncbi:MAG: hypothetical protein ABIX01_04705 [Chitinophagaceae bacterium]
MKFFLSGLMAFSFLNGFSQKPGKPATGHYFSVRVAVVSPLGIFDQTYYSGAGIDGIMHFKWLKKGAEVQAITGYERFKPKRGNIFGNISTIPLKMGLLQMISKQFYLYGRTGVMFVKDNKTSYSTRFSTDAGLGFAFRKFAADIGFHGWTRRNGGGFTNYFSAGVVLPFHRLN